MQNKINNLYEFGGFLFDSEKNKLTKGNDEIVLLSAKAGQVLKMLLDRNQQFVSKQEIFETVWADSFVEDGVLSQNIYTLRKVLGNNQDGIPLIENKSRLGYRITAPASLTIVNSDEIQPLAFPSIESPTAKSRQKIQFKSFLVFILLILAISVGSFVYWRSSINGVDDLANRKNGDMQFQRIVDTGDASFPTLSRDGNFVAFSRRDDGMYVKELQTNLETRVEITNVKKFGVLQFSKDSQFIYLKDSPSFSQGGNVYKVSRFGGDAKLICENVWGGFSLSPNEQEITFIRSFPIANRQVMIVRSIDGSDERELLELNSPQEFYLRSSPSWSADGKSIAVAVNKQNQGFLRFIIANPIDGTSNDLLVEKFKEVSQIIWHPQRNTLIAAAREGKNSQLWEIKYPSNEAKRITNDLSVYLSPKISDDGKKLLVVENIAYSNVWVYESNLETAKKQLTFTKSSLDGFRGLAHFSNGQIIYSSDEGSSSDTNLWKIDPQTNERKQLTINSGSRNENPQVSPDDKFVYFSSNRGGKINIWRMNANGENQTQIASDEESNSSFPQISPDGNWLYFIRTSGKLAAIWRKSLLDNHEETITDEKQFIPTNFLKISPDGAYLAFQNLTQQMSQEGSSQQNFQVAIIETSEPKNGKIFNLTARQLGFSWSADGKSFSYVVPKKGKDEMWLQSLDPTIPPSLLRTIQNETVFNSAISNDGKHFSLSTGLLAYNPVLITNFE